MLDIPQWAEAAAEVAVAAETGVMMRRNRESKDNDPAPVTAPPVIVHAITSDALIPAALIIGAALLIGLMLHAMILNHGLA